VFEDELAMAQVVMLLFVVVMSLPKNAMSLWTYCLAIVAGIKLDPVHFINVNPPIAQLEAELAELSTAVVAAEKRGEGLIEAREAAALVVRKSFRLLKTYLETICEANPKLAAQLMAGIHLKLQTFGHAVAVKVFTASNTKLSGTVLLRVPRPTGSFSVHWAFSLDGKLWTSVPDTTGKASTIINGLTPNTPYFFHAQIVTTKGTGPWLECLPLTVR
jgi:hypothetical protein